MGCNGAAETRIGSGGFSLAARLTQALPTHLSPHIIHDQRSCKLTCIVPRQLIGYTAQEVISR
jgi:hypothetical protein